MPADFARIKDPERREHFVYRLVGKRGRILYIGCTMNFERRMREHFGSALWGPMIVRVKRSGPYNYQTARQLERAAIEELQPPYNIEWTPRHQRGVSAARRRRA